MKQCKSCNGDGYVKVEYDQRKNLSYDVQKCDDCNLYETDEQARESICFKGISSWIKEGYSGDY